MDADWASGHPERVIDFAYRGVHVTTLAAKAIANAYYGQKSRYAYFAGCSDGGREALMEAQRYPEDFDGITAGAPAMNFIAQNIFYRGWNAIANTDAAGKPILTAAQLPVLHNAAVEACDALDGLKDGLISNPTACHFDPVITQCKAGQDQSQCLTSAQVRPRASCTEVRTTRKDSNWFSAAATRVGVGLGRSVHSAPGERSHHEQRNFYGNPCVI